MGTIEFYKAYDAVLDKHGNGVSEKQVLLKAYAQYKADEGLKRDLECCGWMNESYDILSCFNWFGKERIYIPDSFGGASDFRELDSEKTHWRLSGSGSFFDMNKELCDAFWNMSKTVIEV